MQPPSQDAELPSPPVRVFYFRRALSDRSEIQLEVIYAVREGARRPTPGVVSCYGAFPAAWRPTDLPGQVFHDAAARARVWRCEVPRNQFRHYERLTLEQVLARGLAALPRMAGDVAAKS